MRQRWFGEAKCRHNGCPYEATVAVVVDGMFSAMVSFCCPRHLAREKKDRRCEGPVWSCAAADLDGVLAAHDVLSS